MMCPFRWPVSPIHPGEHLCALRDGHPGAHECVCGDHTEEGS